MHKALTAALALLGTIACVHEPETAANPACVPDWRLVYRHDADGNATYGSKPELFDVVRAGAPIRFAWGLRVERDGELFSVEHVAEPVFLTIAGGREIVVQLPEHIGQESYAEASRSSFGKPAVMWRGLMSTTGAFDAVWVDRATGEEVRRLPQRAGIAWLAFVPPEECSRQEALDLAVPGGVRLAE